MTTTDTPYPVSPADNPMLQTEGLPAFDRIAPEHIVPGVEQRLAEIGQQFDALEQSATPTWDGLLTPLEDIDRAFEYCWGPVGHLMAVKNSDALREAYQAVQPKFVQLSLRMSQSRPIYEALCMIRDRDDWERLDLAQQRVIADKIRDAELAGVALEGEAKQRFLEIAERLSSLSTDFSNHLLDATKAFELLVTDPSDAEGWPKTLKTIAAQSYNEAKKPETEATPDAGPWRITLDYPSFVPFLEHSRNRGQREQVHKAFISRASSGEFNNRPLIDEILLLRREQCGLLGFDNYAQVSLSTKMAGDAETVWKMYDELRAACQQGMHDDLDELQRFAAEQGETRELMHWDMAFWAERLREAKFDYTDEQLRPYFPLPRVLDGLYALCTKLFGVSFERDDASAPRWHEDVQYYRVLDESGRPIAGFYLDPYSRPADKQGGAWVNGCLSRRVVAGQVVNPVYHVICNGTPPVGDPEAGGTPSLMSFDEVITLFHEFGHALQGMLTTVDYPAAAGLSGIEWDAVEICSQFMENWCYEKSVLQGMTQHVETGEPLPDELFEKLVKARTFRAGSSFMRQMLQGTTDLILHSTFDPEASTPREVYLKQAKTYAALPPLDEDQFLCAFGHLFAGGYAAGYYSYKWSEVLSADCFGAFEEAGLDDNDAVQQAGRRFRDTFLARGGGEHPSDVFKAFRGRGPSTEALLRHNGLL
ncbi:MAG: M3 family metallopeptidase [Planctomycetota bacterium]